MKKIFTLLVILCILTSCNTFSRNRLNINISDINKEIRIKNTNKSIIGNSEYGKYVNGLYCKINGKVNGIVEIELTNDEGTFSRKIIYEDGKINFSYNADWYEDEFIIKIISNNNATGYINIIYKFSTI
jgi:hypothetical protein